MPTELQQRLENLRREASALNDEIHQITLELQNNCDHSKPVPYSWEHDNGYGRQTMMWGKRCSYCGFVDLWDRNHFVNPSELRD